MELLLVLLCTPTAWDVGGCSPTARVANKLHQPAPPPAPQPPSPPAPLKVTNLRDPRIQKANRKIVLTNRKIVFSSFFCRKMFPRMGKNKYKPLKVTNLRDPRIQKAIDEIKKEIPDPEQHNELLQIWGYIERDSQGNYANIPEHYSALASNEELDAKQKFADLVNKSQQFTIDPNDISANAISELLRNLPRNKQYLITQGGTTFTLNDKIRNEVVHELIAHQRITQRDSENWIADTVVGGQPFTVAEHVVQQTGYAFKEAAFFNHLFKEGIADAFVKLFEQYQIFKYLPDFTKYTKKGVDNENHFGEHYDHSQSHD